jgi:hypothetical protein
MVIVLPYCFYLLLLSQIFFMPLIYIPACLISFLKTNDEINILKCNRALARVYKLVIIKKAQSSSLGLSKWINGMDLD